MTSKLGIPLGWGVGTDATTVDQVRAEARFAADAGFDSFWVSQIFGVDPIVALAASAAETASIPEVGTSVVPLYGRHPLALAAMARTAQDAVDGRFTLGLGPSHAMVVEGFLGLSYARPFTHTREYLEGLLPLLAGEAVDAEGEEVTTKGWLTIDAEPVPVLLAAMGPRMLELAGRLTAGTMLGFPVGPQTIATLTAPTINQAAEAAGRPRPRIMASVSVCVTADPQAAVAFSREKGALYAGLPAYRAMLDREGVESPADLLVAGSEDQVLEGLQRYLDAGATEIRIGAVGADDDTKAASRAFCASLARSA